MHIQEFSKVKYTEILIELRHNGTACINHKNFN